MLLLQSPVNHKHELHRADACSCMCAHAQACDLEFISEASSLCMQPPFAAQAQQPQAGPLCVPGFTHTPNAHSMSFHCTSQATYNMPSAGFLCCPTMATTSLSPSMLPSTPRAWQTTLSSSPMWLATPPPSMQHAVGQTAPCGILPM